MSPRDSRRPPDRTARGPRRRESQGRDSSRRGPASRDRGLPSGYLSGGYFDSAGQLRREIFQEWATGVAEALAAEGLTDAAIRNFFQLVRAIDEKSRHTEDFGEIRPELWKIKPKVAYARGRERAVVGPNFDRFMNTNIDLAATDLKHFRAFVQHFQAVLAYHKALRRGGRGR